MSTVACLTERFFFVLAYAVSILGGRLGAWQLDCVRRLEESGIASLSAVVDDQAMCGLESRASAYDRFLHALHIRLLGGAGMAQLQHFRAELPIIDAWPDNGSIDWQRDVRGCGLDFILHFGERRRGIQLSPMAKYGAWTFVHGEPADSTTDAPGFWEVCEHRRHVEARLVQLRASDVTGVALKSSAFPLAHGSFKATLENMLAMQSHWPLQVCSDILAGVAGYFDDTPLSVSPVYYGVPGPAQILRMRAAQLTNPVEPHLAGALAEAPTAAKSAP
ncbi:MAG TPA: hypothetical protein VFE17_13410 [Candidatus Baltobacteraceae bacterium]|jgi:hypothetical protein|nr:hypothetical protein [Candidatus Baltobacteraceae bacterium]